MFGTKAARCSLSEPRRHFTAVCFGLGSWEELAAAPFREEGALSAASLCFGAIKTFLPARQSKLSPPANYCVLGSLLLDGVLGWTDLG